MVFWNTQLSCTSQFLYIHTPLWFRRYFIHDFTSTKLVWVECYEPIAYNNYCKLGVYPTCYTILSFMGIIWANNQGNGNFKLSIAKSFTKSMVDGNLTNSTILPKIFHLQIVADHIIHNGLCSQGWLDVFGRPKAKIDYLVLNAKLILININYVKNFLFLEIL